MKSPSIKIPEHADPEIQQAFRSISEYLAQLASSDVDLSGRKVINAGEGSSGSDYATVGQLNRAIESVKSRSK